MPQQTINIGAAPDDGTGDTIRAGGDKINDNFTELYAADAALGTAAALDVDPDDTLAADSDSLIPTQQAVKAYVDANVGGGGIDVEDEGVSEATGATTLNFIGANVSAVDAGGGVVNITISGGGSGIDVEDEGVSEATGASTLNFTGAGVTATDAGGGVVDIDIPGGGSAWVLAGAGQTATGVWDFAVDGAKANVDFTGLDGYSELLLVSRLVTKSVSGVTAALLSVNNGSSFYSASGDYVLISAAGAESNQTSMGGLHGTTSTAARSGTLHLPCININGIPKPGGFSTEGTGVQRYFVASTSPVNAVRIFGTGGGTLNGGKIYCLAR